MHIPSIDYYNVRISVEVKEVGCYVKHGSGQSRWQQTVQRQSCLGWSVLLAVFASVYGLAQLFLHIPPEKYCSCLAVLNVFVMPEWAQWSFLRMFLLAPLGTTILLPSSVIKSILPRFAMES